jgi:phage shock protein A
MLNEVSSPVSSNLLERVEEQVLQMEAQSEAMTQLSGDDLEKRFAKLNSHSVDAELAAMKSQMLEDANTTQPGTTLPPSNPDPHASPPQQLPKNPEP